MTDRSLKLLAIKKEPNGSFTCINPLGKAFNLDPDRLSDLLCSHIILLENAKEFLEQSNIKPVPNMRLLCLKTIEKLLSLPKLALDSKSAIKKTLEIINFESEKFKAHELIALECQIIPAVVHMQQRGIPFNKPLWESSLNEFEQEVLIIKAKLKSIFIKKSGFSLFEETIDLRDQALVKTALEELTGHKIKNTAHSSLEHIDHEAVKLLLEYRSKERMLNTFGENFLLKINDDRLRGEFIPLGSSSGRFACQEPNLLALPNHPRFQACVAPKKPYKLLRFDYGAFELRILAALSQDQAMLKIFSLGLDIHSMVAEAIFGQKVSKTQNDHLRQKAKILNFGLIYGMQEKSLSQKLKISTFEAKKLLNAYFKKFSDIGHFLNSLEKKAEVSGFVTTSLGRISILEEHETASHRIARNLPIQGTGADIIKLAICKVYKKLFSENLDAHIINSVHDELIIECLEEQEETIKGLIKTQMMQAHNSILPNIEADISIK
jgi:DNA polymerase I-like protein with 3'-5' exonuclease and polymerase domains